jgi:hypothetical protein
MVREPVLAQLDLLRNDQALCQRVKVDLLRHTPPTATLGRRSPPGEGLRRR